MSVKMREVLWFADLKYATVNPKIKVRIKGDQVILNLGLPDERINRPFTIGYNNWMQAGSINGARWMSVLYTVVTACKLNGIKPEDYLKDVMVSLAMRLSHADVTDLLPVNW